jgi:hypothetical protein
MDRFQRRLCYNFAPIQFTLCSELFDVLSQPVGNSGIVSCCLRRPCQVADLGPPEASGRPWCLPVAGSADHTGGAFIRRHARHDVPSLPKTVMYTPLLSLSSYRILQTFSIFPCNRKLLTYNRGLLRPKKLTAPDREWRLRAEVLSSQFSAECGGCGQAGR